MSDFEAKNEYTEVIGKFEEYQHSADIVHSLITDIDIFEQRYIDELCSCGEWLFFTADDDGALRFHSSSFCRKRLCPLCQWRKALKQYSNCIRIAEALTVEGFRFLHVVLTVPNCRGGSELDKTIKKLYASFNSLMKKKRIKGAFKGVMRCLEVSYNYEMHTFHPHLHCLVAVKKSYFNNSKQYISYDMLRDLWQQSCGAAVPYQVSLGAIKNNLGFAEVSKYCVKPLELDEAHSVDNMAILTELATTLKGRRLIQCYGVIKDIKRQLKLSDDIEDEADREKKLEQMLYTFHYNAHSKRYEAI